MARFSMSKKFAVMVGAAVILFIGINGVIYCSKTAIRNGYQQNILSISGNGWSKISDVVKKVGKPEDRKQPTTETWDVLISSYMRSGSSFLGRILGWRKDSFYWYEPLVKPPSTWSFFRADGRLCDLKKPLCHETKKHTLKAALGFLKDIYQCKLANHSAFVHENLHAVREYTGPSWDMFSTCRNNNTVQKCLTVMEPICREAKHRVTKVLRMDFECFGELLHALPRLKVVLLLRDPRGILSSHLRTKWFPVSLKSVSDFENDVKVVCSRIEKDLEAARRLAERYPGRVKILQFETLGKPHDSASLMYQYLGMSNLKSGMIDMGAFNLTDSGSGDIDPFSYRNTLPWNASQVIDKHCNSLYGKLGLIQYQNLAYLRNRTFPSTKGELPYALT